MAQLKTASVCTHDVSTRPEPRVISLLAASTEIVYRLGMGQALVGRSHECDYPPACLLVPQCSHPTIDTGMSSIAIDTAVRERAYTGQPIYQIQAKKLVELAPNVIITQSQCAVCAVSNDDVQAALEQWAAGQAASCRYTGPGTAVLEGGVRLVNLMPKDLEGVFRDVELVAEALRVPVRGAALVAHLRARMDYVRQAIQPHLEGGEQPRVALLEWDDPLMGSGHWLPELASAAGGRCLFGEPGGEVPTLTVEELAAADPDVIAFTPCGYDIVRIARELTASGLLDRPQWQALRAVRAGRVFVTDGNNFFNRSSPRVVDSAEALAEMLWPPLRGLFGHHGAVFVSLEQGLAWAAAEQAAADAFAAEVPASGEGAAAQAQQQSGDARDARPADGTAGLEEAGPLPPELQETLHTPDSAARQQVQLLRSGAFAQAFRLNTPSNQRRIGSPAAFRTVCCSATYAPLCAATDTLIETSVQDCQASSAHVLVTCSRQQEAATSPPAAACYVFAVRKQASGALAGCWLTDSVHPSSIERC